MSQRDKTELCATIVEAASAVRVARDKLTSYRIEEPPELHAAFWRCIRTLEMHGEHIAAIELRKLNGNRDR